MKKLNKDIIPYLILVLIFVFCLTFDLVTKSIVNNKMELGQRVGFINGFISFYYVHNTGAAWSIFSGKQIFLILFTFIFLAIMVFYYIREKSKSYLFNIACGFILGGTIGNLVDRMFLGYVRDFINLEFINFPVFNIADSALTIGVILFLIYLVIAFVKDSKKGEKND